MLLTCDQLARQLDSPELKIFDCRHDLMDIEKGERLYREAHIPGAYFLHLDRDLSASMTGGNGRHPLPAPADFIRLLSEHGVTQQSTIVAYDDAGGMIASRLWWMCRWIGLKHVFLLDGGISKWMNEGRAVTAELPIKKVAPLAARANPLMVMTAVEIEARLNTDDMRLIDARAAERYRGEVEPIDPVAGHIPSALNRFCKINLNADFTFRPVAEIKREFEVLLGGVDPQRVVHQCGSGVTACANLFAMEYAGLQGSKLYAGSWSEWIADPARPVSKD